jgi:quercetin dioxygenase-like cupin family protein
MNPKHVGAGEGKELNVLGGAMRVLLSGSDTAGRLTLVEQSVMPGYGIPLHVHTREDEIFHVLEGEVELQMNGKTVKAGAGEVIYTPRNLPHSFRIVGTGRAHLHLTITPGGLEKMFEELSLLSMPPEMDKVGAVCGQYGIRFV